MRRMMFSLVVVLLAYVPASAQTGRPLALEDYYSLKNAVSPRISPAGDWIAYMVELRVEETNGTATESWIVRTDGSAEPVKVEHDGQDVVHSGWTDDGRLRYGHQGATWMIDPARLGGRAARDESVEPAGALSPDGQWRAVTRDIPRPPRPEPDMTAFERRHDERFKGIDFDWYPFRRDRQAFPIPDAGERPLTEIFLEPTGDNGEARQLTHLGLRPGSVQWRPDGSDILFTADEAVLDELAYGRSDLFVVTMDGELDRLTDDGYTYSGVEYSPDGRWITYTRSFGTNMIIDTKLRHGGPRDLYVRAADGGEPVNLTREWDLDPGGPMWSPDGRYIYFVSGIGGARHLFRVSPEGGGVEQVTTGHRRINGLDIDASFERMTYTVGEFERPSDIYVSDIDGGNERRLTDLYSDFLDEVEVAGHPSERILYESYDGTPVEGFLLFPYGYDPDTGTYPLIVMNHGGPHSASGYGFNFKNQLFAANGYFVHGEVDYRVPTEGSIQMYTSLKKQGVPTRLIIYEGMAHGIRGHWNNVHRMINELGWWETYLKPRAAVTVSYAN